MKVFESINTGLNEAIEYEKGNISANTAKITRENAIAAFEELRKQAADLPEMSLEEINAEIADVRKSKKNR